jgi:hypothetical protein
MSFGFSYGLQRMQLDFMKENWRPGKLQLRVEESARNEASMQLLRVPNDEFARATRRYVWWEAFVLWIRTVARFERGIPSVAREALRQYCASFLRDADLAGDPSLLSRRLDEWIRGRFFARPRREGWFEAVVFYSARDPKLKYAYAYWEQCEREWAAKPPHPSPEFDAWFKSACNCALFPVDANRLGKAVQSYLGWLSLASWLEPLLDNDLALPSRLVNQMKTTGHRFREIAGQLESRERCAMATKFHLIRWIENHYFVVPQAESWIELVRHHTQNDPRQVRTSEYARRWREHQPQNRLRLYPSFTKWCEDAKNFVERARG